MRSDGGYFEEEKLGKVYDAKLIGRLYPFSRPYRFVFLGTILLVVLITLLQLALPYVTKLAIDRYIVPAPAGGPLTATQASPAPGRYLRADLTDPAVQAVVDKYPHMFVHVPPSALIRLENIRELAKADLAVLRRKDLAGIGRLALLFLAIVLLDFAFNFIQVLAMEYTGQMIMHDLRCRLFAHIQGLSVAFFNHTPVGRLVTRVTNDIQNMNELFTSVVTFVFKDLFLLVGIIAVLISIDWRLALICLTVVPFVLFASARFAVQARDTFRTLRVKIAEINTRFAETIGGIRVIQLFGQEQTNYRAFARLNHENYLAGMRQIRIFAVFMPIIEIMNATATAAVIYYGGGNVIQERISLGALVAFISYMKMFFRPIRDIAEKYNIVQNAMASAERIFQILDTTDRLPQPVEIPATEALSPPLQLRIATVGFESVAFSYVPGEPVLRGVSFEIRPGETVAVVGPTGSGKTTLVNLLPRFYDTTTGRVLINGRDIRDFPSTRLRSRMALVMQDPFLFSGTIRHNIWPADRPVSEAALRETLVRSRCDALIAKLPEGLDTVLAEGGASISSGERQLITLARALAHDPDLIILDEATSHIDSETEQRIQEALQNLMQNRTALVVAHRLATARNADRIIVLHRGRVIETGTHAELLALRGFYYRLNQLQN